MALEDLIKDDLAEKRYSIALEKEFFSYFILMADNPWAMNFPACWQCFLKLERYKPLFAEPQFRSDFMMQILKRGGWQRKTLVAIEKVMKEYCGDEWSFFKKEFKKKKRKTVFQKPLKGDCKLQQAILIDQLKKIFRRRAGRRVNFNNPQVASEFLEKYFIETRGKENIYTRTPEAIVARKGIRREAILLILFCLFIMLVCITLQSQEFKDGMDYTSELIYEYLYER